MPTILKLTSDEWSRILTLKIQVERLREEEAQLIARMRERLLDAAVSVVRR